MNRQNLLHHLATAAGFAGLIAWYYFAKALGILDWSIQMVPEKYAGAGLMIGVMLVMTPGFFLWNQWNRWIQNKLKITGKYYEDGIYKEPDDNK